MTYDFSHQYHAKDVEIVEQELIFKGFFTVTDYRLRYRLFSGEWGPIMRRQIMRRYDAAAVLIYDPAKDAVVMIEQFRMPAYDDPSSPWLFELVAGVIDTGHTPEEIARNEAKEEADCELHELQHIYSYHSSPGCSHEVVHLFYAETDSTQLGGIHGAEGENEDIKVHIIPRQEAFQAVTDGIINNATAILALQWLQLRHLGNQGSQ